MPVTTPLPAALTAATQLSKALSSRLSAWKGVSCSRAHRRCKSAMTTATEPFAQADNSWDRAILARLKPTAAAPPLADTLYR